jgi:flagellar biosynthetic protein FliR
MDPGVFSQRLALILLLSLRITPVFAFAPPFSLIRVPITLRVLLGLGLAACLVGMVPGAGAPGAAMSAGDFAVMAVRELFIGLIFVASFQLAFAALQMAGRVLDLQTGFGFSNLVDPTSQTQAPLTGTIFTLAAGIVFFALNGHLELLRLFAASLEVAPLGQEGLVVHPARLGALATTLFVVGLGVAGASMIALFLADIGVALVSRTAPQMNALMFGIQIKSLILLLTLPICIGGSLALFARLSAMALQSAFRLLG